MAVQNVQKYELFRNIRVGLNEGSEEDLPHSLDLTKTACLSILTQNYRLHPDRLFSWNAPFLYTQTRLT